MNLPNREEKNLQVPFIGLSSGIGGRHLGSKQGPLKLQSHLISCNWKSMISFQDDLVKNKIDTISQLNENHAKAAFETFNEYGTLISIGGDHSCGLGTWSGISEALYKNNQKMGIVWIDAHMDCHTTKTSLSQNPHGMPLAALMGHGSDKLTNILSERVKIDPENVFLVGIRSYEDPEKQLLEKLGCRIYYIEEVCQKGIQNIIQEIIEYFKSKNLKYGISLDLDFFDPKVISATGTPEPGGIHPDEFISSCSVVEQYPPVAFEYVEFNPELDLNNTSLNYSLKIIGCMQKILTENLKAAVSSV